MANIEKMIEGASEQIGGTLKGMMRKYKEGRVTDQQVYARMRRDLETFINSVSPSRNKEGQVVAVGTFGPIQVQMLRDAIAELEFGKFTEFQQEPIEGQVCFSVQITVLSAGAELFRASLKAGMLHQRGWDRFLTIS